MFETAQPRGATGNCGEDRPHTPGPLDRNSPLGPGSHRASIHNPQSYGPEAHATPGLEPHINPQSAARNPRFPSFLSLEGGLDASWSGTYAHLQAPMSGHIAHPIRPTGSGVRRLLERHLGNRYSKSISEHPSGVTEELKPVAIVLHSSSLLLPPLLGSLPDTRWCQRLMGGWTRTLHLRPGIVLARGTPR